MAKAIKLSVSVDALTLEEIRRLAPEASISFLVDDALKQKLGRLRLRALLDEMEIESPMSDRDRSVGDKLWEQAESFLIQGRSRPSQRGTAASAGSSSAPSKKKPKSSSRQS
jgi:hypothetical protein